MLSRACSREVSRAQCSSVPQVAPPRAAWLCASIRPGMTVRPARSMLRAWGYRARRSWVVPTASTRPPPTTMASFTAASSRSGPTPRHTRPFTSRITSSLFMPPSPHQVTAMYWDCLNSSRPLAPFGASSLCFTPPDGALGSDAFPRLSSTIPLTSLCAKDPVGLHRENGVVCAEHLRLQVAGLRVVPVVHPVRYERHPGDRHDAGLVHALLPVEMCVRRRIAGRVDEAVHLVSVPHAV